MSNLGLRVVAFRESRKLTQEQLAKKCGVRRSTLARCENENDASWETLNLLRRALELASDEWLVLLIEWIANTIGEENFARVNITTSSLIKEEPLTDEARLLAAIERLTPAQRRLIIDTCERPPLFGLLKELHSLYDKLTRPPN